MASTLNTKCDTCGETAVSFCEECQGLLCSKCLDAHQQTNAFINHRPLDLSRQDKDGSVIRYVLCPDHHIYISYYCHDCHRGMCRQCVPENHAKHEAQDLPSLQQTRRSDLNEVLKTLEELAKDLQASEAEPGEIQAEALSTIAKAEEDFQEHLEACAAGLKTWEEKSRRDLEDSKTRLAEDVNAILSRRNKHLSDIKELEDKTNGLLCSKRPLEVVEKTEDVMKKVELLKANSVKAETATFVRGTQLLPEVLPPTLGDFKDVTIGPASNRQKLTFWTKAGRGSKLGELLSPCDVLLLPSGELLLADWGNGRVQRFLSTGDMPTILLQDVKPERLAATSDGLLMVTDDNKRAVLSFTPEGKVVREWNPQHVDRPWGLAVNRDSSRVVTDYTSSTGYVYTAEEVLQCEFGGFDSFRQREPWLLNLPSYVCCDLHGRIVVSDCNNHAIKIFDSSGQFLLTFGKRGLTDGQLRYPRGVCVDNANNILVADWGNDRISQFSPDGQFIRHAFSKDMAEQFGWPYGLSYLSGIFNDGVARIAITTESPDALLTVPYHHPHQDLQPEASSLSKGSNENYDRPSSENEGDKVKDDTKEYEKPDTAESTLDKDTENTPGQRPNLRRVSHGSSAGRMKSGIDSEMNPSVCYNSESSAPRECAGAGDGIVSPEPSNLTESRGPSRSSSRGSNESPPWAGNDNKSSVQSTKSRLSSRHVHRGAKESSPQPSIIDQSSPPQSPRNTQRSDMLNFDGSSMNFAPYSPSTGEPTVKRNSGAHHKKTKERRSSDQAMQAEGSLDSIPEKLSTSVEESSTNGKTMSKGNGSRKTSSTTSSRRSRSKTSDRDDQAPFSQDDVFSDRKSLNSRRGSRNSTENVALDKEDHSLCDFKKE